MQTQQQQQTHTYGGNLAETTLDGDAIAHVGVGVGVGSLDVVSAGERTRPCPKCGARAALYATDCRRCGVNFARHRMTIEIAAQARPVYSARTEHERRTGKTAIRMDLEAPPKTTSMMPLVLVTLTVLAGLAFALWG